MLVIVTHQFQGGLILEVAIAKYWANLGEMYVDYTIEFHGIRVVNGDLAMHSADGINRLELKSSLRNEEVVPSISLKSTVQVLRCAELSNEDLCKTKSIITFVVADHRRRNSWHWDQRTLFPRLVKSTRSSSRTISTSPNPLKSRPTPLCSVTCSTRANTKVNFGCCTIATNNSSLAEMLTRRRYAICWKR